MPLYCMLKHLDYYQLMMGGNKAFKITRMVIGVLIIQFGWEHEAQFWNIISGYKEKLILCVAILDDVHTLLTSFAAVDG